MRQDVSNCKTRNNAIKKSPALKPQGSLLHLGRFENYMMFGNKIFKSAKGKN